MHLGLCLRGTLLLLSANLIASDMVTYKMEDMCGEREGLSSSSAMVTFRRSPSLLGIVVKPSCDFVVSTGSWTEDVSWNRLNVQILDFQNRGNSCLSFYQTERYSIQSTSLRDVFGLSNPYCGSKKPPLNTSLILEKYASLMVKFQASKYSEDGDVSFKLVVNVFHTDGSCTKYQCSNDRCIPFDLKCSEYNPCGDGSHCQATVPVLTIVCIIAGVLGGIILLIFVIKCLRDRRKYKADEDEEETTNQIFAEETELQAIGNETQQSGLQNETRQPVLRTETRQPAHRNGTRQQERNEVRQQLPPLRTGLSVTAPDEDGGRSPDVDYIMPPPSYEEVMLEK